MSVIQASGLRKVFRTGFLMRAVEAVKGVDLDVTEGEIFGFIGPNGAGKTTTIKMLTGLIMPTGGSASIHGIPVPAPASRKRLGFLPEGTFFHDYLTGREFLDFHAPARRGASKSPRYWNESVYRTPATSASDATRRGCASESGWPSA